MLPETVNCNVHYSSYWERPYTQWKLSSWDDFYLEKYPNASKWKSHDFLGSELDALIKNLKPKTKNHNKVLLLKRNLEKLKSEKNNGKEEESKKKRKAVEEYSVRRKIGAPDNVKVKDIELWRVNVPFEEFKENSILLNNIEVKEKLFPTVKISSVFDDEIPELKIHFIVKVPANIEKDENVKEICKMPCPSTSASPGKWKKCNKNPLKIYNLRPPECSGPPVSLYHPVFSQFLLNYRNNELEILLKHYTEVLNLCNVAGQIYQNESDRQHALRPFFTSLFDGIQPISIVTDNGSIDDYVLLIDNTVFEEKAVPILWEYKNEIGTERKDPSIQGRCGYAKYWAQSQIKNNKY
ncbi:unnamed protein product [Rhizophagus irregularis]|uniref:Uncharacterized protein n=1 Tax=Rhizophagus irregularis TaxID=588596 RepID=A0A915ZIU0_9GLOM|nr:unnamed protein product [Rhizophagus irregularis]CAB5376080.1 unnamed protein product [Rhizophagus irregularis]